VKRHTRLGFAIGILLLITIPLLVTGLPDLTLAAVTGRIQSLVTIFLGIFIEAVPFLLAGSLVSGLISVFVSRESLMKLIPRHPVLAAVMGALMGLVFPVCECGVVPVTRRLYQKGVPLSVGVSFMLAAPVVNPVVIASTVAAFGWGPMLAGRLGISLLIAVTVGTLFHLAQPEEVLQDAVAESCQHGDCHHPVNHGQGKRLWDALASAGDDFLEMVRFLIIGSFLAAGMQTLIPQSALLNLAHGIPLSILVMLALAFVLSVCSTVDAFLALAFVNVFPPAAILGFLVFGPMVDIKSTLMFTGVFRRQAVAYLVLLPLVMSLLAGLALSFLGGW
jgi:uncharacterized protein